MTRCESWGFRKRAVSSMMTSGGATCNRSKNGALSPGEVSPSVLIPGAIGALTGVAGSDGLFGKPEFKELSVGRNGRSEWDWGTPELLGPGTILLDGTPTRQRCSPGQPTLPSLPAFPEFIAPPGSPSPEAAG
jgi:hypothetical protein